MILLVKEINLATWQIQKVYNNNNNFQFNNKEISHYRKFNLQNK
jgi:hypothetical protein